MPVVGFEVVRRALLPFLVLAACSRFDEASGADSGPGGGGEAGPGTAAEAGLDGADVESPGPTFCSVPVANQIFCEDFETEKLPDFGFNNRVEDGTGLAATRMIVPGRGQVLRYEVMVPAGKNTWFRFGPPVPSRDLKFSSLKLRMDVSIVSQAVTGVLLAGIWVIPDPAAGPLVHGIALHGNPELQSSLAGLSSGMAHAITLARWYTVTIELRRNNGSYERHTSIDGTEIDFVSVVMPAGGEWDVRIGAYYGDTASLVMLVDNVVVTRE